MKFEELSVGGRDRVARAACAIVAAPMTMDPSIIGRAVAIALAKHGFASRPRRWHHYARAVQGDGGRTNRQWPEYPRIEQRLASRLAKEIRSLL